MTVPTAQTGAAPGMLTGDLSSPQQPAQQVAVEQRSPSAQPKLGYSQPPSSSALKFKPDGFHTSASDPALQQKYGHRREVGVVQQNGNIVAGPPPSGPLYNSPASAYSNGGPSNVFQRYVAMDYATNMPIPAPAPGTYGSLPPQGPMSSMPPMATGLPAAPPQAQIFLPQQQSQQQYLHQPPSMGSAPPAAPGIVPQTSVQSAGAPQPMGGGLAAGGAPRQGGFGPPQVQVFSKPLSQSSLSSGGSGKHSQDSGDNEVIALGSSSNSVM